VADASALLSAALVIGANGIIFFAAGQVRGGVLAHHWAPYYEATGLWQRLIVAGIVYAAIIGPFTYAFALNASSASLTQAVMGALMVLGLAVAVGGKAITVQMALATLAIAASSLWIAWAVSAAPNAPAARDVSTSTKQNS
jgi:hypothetical protein